MAVKIKDTEFVTVIVSHRNPEAEGMSTFVGGNNIVINGKKFIKHYNIELGKEVSIPKPFVKQLENRAQVEVEKNKQGKQIVGGKPIRRKLFVVEHVAKATKGA